VYKILRKFDINSLYPCPLHLYTVTTLPWESKKSFFSSIIHSYFRLLTLSQKKTNAFKNNAGPIFERVCGPKFTKFSDNAGDPRTFERPCPIICVTFHSDDIRH